MTLSIDVARRAGDFELAVALTLEGPVTALFGPSGAGKTMLLNILAGLVRPSSGRVALDGEVWFDSAAGIFTPPHKRCVGYVFQEARLFPHLSVRQNLDYGRWFARRREKLAEFDEVVSLLGIEQLLARRPQNLSGGEAQRVAIGRALLAGPRLMLMDEPLASLDAARRADILPWIEKLRERYPIPIVYVSHSLEELEQVASEIVTMDNGAATGLRRAGKGRPR